jgi:hypothetical protein
VPTPLTDDERATILRLHGEGKPRNHIAREVGRSAGTVSNVVHGAGLTFDRPPGVVAATQAKLEDNREKRARLESLLLDDALALREQLYRPHRVFSFGGRDNTYEEHEHPEPDVAAKATILRGVGIAVDKAVKLAEVDKAVAGADEGRSIIGAFFDALGVADPPAGDSETPDPV